MADKSAGPSQVISLPKGGGALSGIGEKFSPDLHTGTGNFSVPIALPPGRNGFQPQLTLAYSTGNGNGPFGLGWSLSIPGVSRLTSKGIPLYDEDSDTYVLSVSGGSRACGRSIPGQDSIPPTNGRAVRPDRAPFGPRHGSLGGCEQGRTCQRLWYARRARGGSCCHRGPFKPPSRIRVEADIDPRYVWQQDSVRLLARGLAGSLHHWDQIYLNRIRYVDYTDPAGGEQFLVCVQFH